MKKSIALIVCAVFLISSVKAQAVFRTRPNGRHRTLPAPRDRHLQKFKPSVNISFGYGVPNLDKYELLEFRNYYHTSVNQNGPVFGTIEYQFNRTMSVGAMVSYGKLNSPYYSSNGSGLAFTGYLKNTSLMLSFVRYIISGNEKIVPYMRTAIGINMWTQDYLDQSGNKAIIANDPTAFAYQVSLGTKLMLAKQAGFFVEAGYGKYILSGGLTFKF
jgi:hypothetical protein